MSAEVQAARYRAVRPIASGGMGRVVLAEDQLLARKVALKRLHTGGDERELVRLRREAQVGASLSHPNLVAVHDVFFDEQDLVIVMEYVEGETLRDAMRRGPLSPPRALQVLDSMAAALDHIHERGVIHRDVKPANVLLRSDGVVKLGDLGVASAMDRTRITTSGTVLGTVGYMAPEQLEGDPASPQVDIYALAAVAFEALSGRRARTETNPLALARAIAMGPPPDMLAAWPDAPPEAAAVLRHGMASRPQDRPRTAGELMGRLEAAVGPHASGPTVASAGPAPEAEDRAPASAGSAPPRPTPERGGARRSAHLPAGGAAVEGAGAIAAAGALGGAEDGAQAASPPQATAPSQAAASSTPEVVRSPPPSAPKRRMPPAPGQGGEDPGPDPDPAPRRGPDARPPAPTSAQTALRRGPPAPAAPGAQQGVTPASAESERSAGRYFAAARSAGEPASVRSPGRPDSSAADHRGSGATTSSPEDPGSAPRARRRGPVLVAIAALLAAGAVTAAVLASGTASRAPTRPGAGAPTASGAAARSGQQGAAPGGKAAGGAVAARPGATAGGARTTRLAPAGGTAGSGDPVSALKSFYGLAAHHNYAAAWNLADASMRAQVAGYASFSGQQSHVHSITFDRAALVSSRGSQATVSLATTPVLDAGTQHCQGTARLVKAGGGWVMHGIGVACTTPQ